MREMRVLQTFTVPRRHPTVRYVLWREVGCPDVPWPLTRYKPPRRVSLTLIPLALTITWFALYWPWRGVSDRDLARMFVALGWPLDDLFWYRMVIEVARTVVPDDPDEMATIDMLEAALAARESDRDLERPPAPEAGGRRRRRRVTH